MTLRGPYIMVHDVTLAREFLAPLQAAHLQAIAPSQITVASSPGQGWRSRAAAKAAQKDASQLSEQRCRMGFDVNEEVKARLAALEVVLHAQVEQQINEGIDLHSGRQLVMDTQHVRSVAAKHMFKNQKPFDEVSDKEWRRLQRSRGSSARVFSSNAAGSNEGDGQAGHTHVNKPPHQHQECDPQRPAWRAVEVAEVQTDLSRSDDDNGITGDPIQASPEASKQEQFRAMALEALVRQHSIERRLEAMASTQRASRPTSTSSSSMAASCSATESRAPVRPPQSPRDH